MIVNDFLEDIYMNKKLIRLKEVSNRTNLSTATLRRMIKRKDIEAIKLGGNYYLTPLDYNNLITFISLKKFDWSNEDIHIFQRYLYKQQEKQNQEINKLYTNILEELLNNCKKCKFKSERRKLCIAN